jgi:hypothetical protein
MRAAAACKNPLQIKMYAMNERDKFNAAAPDAVGRVR